MKRKIKDLFGYHIGGTDGEIGKVDDFYFDDKTWTIRYLVVETGNWLSGRRVLISPEAFLRPEWDNKIFHLNLTKDQIKNSPDIDTNKPVSRQEEMRLYKYYPWRGYWEGGLWAGGIGTTGMIMPSPLPAEAAIKNKEQDGAQHGDEHLRSIKKVEGYTIHATDGEIGDVKDFILNDDTWAIEFLLVDTGSFFPGKKVLISPQWINSVDWETSEVAVKVTQDHVKESPEYDPDQPISEAYANSLHSHYNEPVY